MYLVFVSVQFFLKDTALAGATSRAFKQREDGRGSCIRIQLANRRVIIDRLENRSGPQSGDDRSVRGATIVQKFCYF